MSSRRQTIVFAFIAALLPFAAVASIGTTGTGAVDPVAEVAGVCREEGLWLHIDACYGGAARLVPELRSLFDGIERADSI